MQQLGNISKETFSRRNKCVFAANNAFAGEGSSGVPDKQWRPYGKKLDGPVAIVDTHVRGFIYKGPETRLQLTFSHYLLALVTTKWGLLETTKNEISGP